MSQAVDDGAPPTEPTMASARTSLVIRRLQMVIGLQMEGILRPLDLTPGQYTLLSMVARRPALSAAQLARRLQVRPPTMAELISPLERKKWISRREDEDNRRVLRVSITAAGREVLARSDHLMDGLEAKLFDVLAPAERERFHRTALTILRAAGRDVTRLPA
jgi:DNA-binding MarR family transcriptional regulator